MSVNHQIFLNDYHVDPKKKSNHRWQDVSNYLFSKIQLKAAVAANPENQFDVEMRTIDEKGTVITFKYIVPHSIYEIFTTRCFPDFKAKEDAE